MKTMIISAFAGCGKIHLFRGQDWIMFNTVDVFQRRIKGGHV